MHSVNARPKMTSQYFFNRSTLKPLQSTLYSSQMSGGGGHSHTRSDVYQGGTGGAGQQATQSMRQTMVGSKNKMGVAAGDAQHLAEVRGNSLAGG